MAGFFDDEAELGSDDENNDDIKKQINKKKREAKDEEVFNVDVELEAI